MKILICGDVVGKAGRRVVCEALPTLRRELDLDFIVVNGENAAGGFGITPKICDQFFDAGADVITTGNHAWDQKDIIPHFDREKRILRPHNYPEGTPGTGVAMFPDHQGRNVLVVHFMGLLFMPSLDDPFAGVDMALLNRHLGSDIAAIIVDFHGEATSEKLAFAHMLDGRVSAVISDIGMCGDYDSVIGMKKEGSIERFRKKLPGPRLEAAVGEATLCAVYIETDDETGFAQRVEPLRMGGRLAPARPV
jgi:metallophosphoesterase (TIGR00282 family)